jgi:hypothetical protein
MSLLTSTPFFRLLAHRGRVARADRQAKFRLNEDMEILHTLDTAAGGAFLNRFFAPHQGKYEIGVAASAEVETQVCELSEV